MQDAKMDHTTAADGGSTKLVDAGGVDAADDPNADRKGPSRAPSYPPLDSAQIGAPAIIASTYSLAERRRFELQLHTAHADHPDHWLRWLQRGVLRR